MIPGTLIKAADAAFRTYMRAQWMDVGGYIKCKSCGHWKHPRYIDVGHVVGRQYFATRYDQRNVWPQCKNCNQNGGGDLLKKFMDEFIFNELSQLAHNPAFRLTPEFLTDVLNRYSQ